VLRGGPKECQVENVESVVTAVEHVAGTAQEDIDDSSLDCHGEDIEGTVDAGFVQKSVWSSRQMTVISDVVDMGGEHRGRLPAESGVQETPEAVDFAEHAVRRDSRVDSYLFVGSWAGMAGVEPGFGESGDDWVGRDIVHHHRHHH
jgi:hypothetical protein